MGSVGIQFDFVEWQHVLVGWHFSRPFVLFPENQIPTGIGRTIILGHPSIHVSETHVCESNHIFLQPYKTNFLFIFVHFRKSYFPDVRGGVHGFGFPPQNQRTDQPAEGAGGGNAQNRFFGGNNFGWGRGQRLGRD